MSLASQLLKLSSTETVTFATGVVTDTSPFTVHLNGDDVDIVSPSRLASYTPTLGDNVIVLRPGPALIVLDAIA